MKSIKTMLYLTLPLTLFILFACERTYPDGATEEVGWFDATLDIFGGTPKRTKKDLLKEKQLTDDAEKNKAIIKENNLIAAENVKIEKHNKGAKDDEENPNTGLLGLLGVVATATGYGWVRTFLNKKTVEAARSLADKQRHVSNARYQAIKDGYRDDASVLDKIKLLAKEGTIFARQNMELIEKNPDDIEIFKAIMAKAKEKS